MFSHNCNKIFDNYLLEYLVTKINSKVKINPLLLFIDVQRCTSANKKNLIQIIRIIHFWSEL